MPQMRNNCNQLDHVICQVRFNAHLSINRDIDLFQVIINSDYPNYSPESITSPGVINPTGVGHTFSSEDGKWMVSLSTSAMSLTTSAYENWDDFVTKFMFVFNSLIDVFGIESFTRVGLRYVNAIRPEILDMPADSKSILKGPVSEMFSDSTGSFVAGTCIIDRNQGDEILSRSAVGTIVFTDDQPGFAIDNDVFTTKSIAVPGVSEMINRFNEVANALFKEFASDGVCKKVGL